MADKKPQRRSALADWTGDGQPSQAAQTPVSPVSPLDQIRGAEPRKRNRTWEGQHHTCSYRGVPQDIQDQVVALAASLLVNTDELVQVFVQYGLSCLERGILTISPRPKAQRMTLYPLPNGWGQQAGWSEATEGWEPGQSKEIPAKRKASSKEGSSTLWKRVVTYRLSTDSVDSIARLAEQHTVPIGEVMTLLLKHGLESYKSGRLLLNPQPKVIRNTLMETAP